MIRESWIHMRFHHSLTRSKTKSLLFKVQRRKGSKMCSWNCHVTSHEALNGYAHFLREIYNLSVFTQLLCHGLDETPVNFLVEYSKLEFRVFFLLDWLLNQGQSTKTALLFTYNWLDPAAVTTFRQWRLSTVRYSEFMIHHDKIWPFEAITLFCHSCLVHCQSLIFQKCAGLVYLSVPQHVDLYHDIAKLLIHPRNILLLFNYSCSTETLHQIKNMQVNWRALSSDFLVSRILKFIGHYWTVRVFPMALETWVQSLVEWYQRLKKWYLMPPCLTLSIIR